jgi:hypothetical protein
MWLIETKGWEQADTPLKDARAEEWCHDASKLTGTKWQYKKVKYTNYMTMTANLSKWPALSFSEFLEKLKNDFEKMQITLVE